MYNMTTNGLSLSSGPPCAVSPEPSSPNASWESLVDHLETSLRNTTCSDRYCNSLALDVAYAQWWGKVGSLRQESGVIYLVGNGASASMASHMAADLDKNGRVRAMVFSDSALLTALANDYSYEEIYSVPLRQRMAAKDMLVAISSSGNSSNILNACYVAQRLGAFVVTLSAMRPDNPLRQLGNLNYYVPAQVGDYGLAESAHHAILHHWMDIVAAQHLPSMGPTRL